MILLFAFDSLKVDSLWEIAKKWRAGYDVAVVDSARYKIISIGEEAVFYIIKKHISKKDRFGARAVRDMCLKRPEYCTRGISYLLDLGDTIALKNALYVSSEVKIPGLEGKLLKVLKRQKEGRWISRTLRAIYKSGDNGVCNVLMDYLNHPYEYVRMRAALLVGEKECMKLKGYMWKMMKDSVFTVRDAAKSSLIKLGFSLKEFEKNIKEIPDYEVMKLLYMNCPSGNYLRIAERNVDKGIFNAWKDFINCK